MLLAAAGIDPSEVRLLRHQTDKVLGRTPYSLWCDHVADFEQYQCIQKSTQRARFNGQYWASFVVPPSGETLFVGLYKVSFAGAAPADAIDPLSGGPVGGIDNRIPYDLYETKRVEALSEYTGRLFIHWGDTISARRTWVQRADNQNKEIVELTRDFREESFPGFTKLIRPLSQIETMPPSWKEVLRASRGVYLLACPRTREHYVGSASGENGFLGRWRAYAANSHGGNVGLRGRDWSDYLVSVLEVAASSASIEDIVALENTWKTKLHSRAIGLNHN
jgi:hypothetical protein